MPRSFEDYSADDALDERGVLRDGHRLRISMAMRDSLSPVQRAIMEDRVVRDFGLTDALALHKPGYRFGDAQGESAKLSAYDEMCRDLTEAWRHPVRDEPAIPVGAYPISAGEGRACTTNGQPGRLVKSAGGDWLTCEPDRLDLSRSDSVPPRMIDADESWRIRSEAWHRMLDEQAEAWRPK
jgi:hypothetical protein